MFSATDREGVNNLGSCIAALRIIVCMAAMGITAPSSANSTPTDDHRRGPLILEQQGTFYVGGKIEFRNPNQSDPTPTNLRSLPGNIAIDQMYVEYQIPATLKYAYPIVLMHGDGQNGGFFRTTPDGREGWFTSFARRGFAVYSVDGANRGRAGWDPTKRFAATQGLIPPSSMEAASIYSEQSAWVAYRWGPAFGTAYMNTQFPLNHVQDYLKEIQPSFHDDKANAKLQAELEALIDKIGPCILLGWSTGSGNVMVAATATPDRMRKVKGIVAIEGYPGTTGNRPPELIGRRNSISRYKRGWYRSGTL